MERTPTGLVIVIDQLGVGGSELHTLRILDALAARGVLASVVHFQTGGALLPRLERTGHRIHHVPVGSVMRPEGWRAALRLRRLLQSIGATVVHSQCLYSNIFSALAIGIAPPRGMRLVTSRRWDRYSLSRGSTILNRWAHRRSFLVTVNSAGLRGVVADEGVDPVRVRHLPNIPDPAVESVDVGAVRAAVRAQYGLAADAFVVGCVARLQPIKRHVDVLRAFVRVRDAMPGSRLLLAGGGPLHDELRSLADSLGIAADVIFAGETPSLPPVAAACDVALLVSDSEGTPNALVEAAFCGVPIVATAVGGNHEVVRDGVSGVLVAPRDPEAIADAVIGLARDERRRLAFGRAGRAHVAAEYGADTGIERLVQLYREAGAWEWGDGRAGTAVPVVARTRHVEVP